MRVALLFAVAILCPFAAIAQEKATKGSENDSIEIPAPGSWVKFLLSQEGVESDGTLTVRMLDVVVDRKQRFRRVEFDWLIATREAKQRVVTQYLLSEHAIVSDEAPFSSLQQIRTTTLEGSRIDQGPILASEVETLPVDGETKKNLTTYGWHFLFPGATRGRKAILNQREVEFQRGTLVGPQMIEVTQARDRKDLVANNENIDRFLRQTDYRVWRNPKVPFGLVVLEQRQKDIAYDRQGKLLGEDPMPLLTWTLSDFGTGAKSALPN